MIHVVIGPTASGKTSFSIDLAKKVNAEIINVDAYSIYKELDIVSAKVTKEQQSQVKHHFVSHYDLRSKVDIALFQNDVRLKIAQLQNQNKNIVLVGGSNLYMQSILFCYEITANEAYNYAKYENYGLDELLNILKSIDIQYYQICQNNKRRIIKAILYYEKYHQKYSSKENKSTVLYYDDVLFYYMEVERELLYEQINKRVDVMFDLGLVQEYQMLSAKYGTNLQAFKAIGFKEFSDFKSESLEFIQAKIKQNTRRFAKRQISWLNNKILNNPSLNIKIIKK